jgi:Flp pilus assembly protein TadD
MAADEDRVPSPEESQQYLDQAYAFEEHRELEKALRACDLALHVAPQRAGAEAHNLRGIILDELGRTREATAAFREAVRLDPSHADARQNLEELEAEGAQAQQHLAQAQELLDRRQEYGAALRECEAAIALAPDLAEAHNFRGLVLDALGRAGQAMAAYREAVRLAPGLIDAQRNLLEAETEAEAEAEAAPAQLAPQAVGERPPQPQPEFVSNRTRSLLARCFLYAILAADLVTGCAAVNGYTELNSAAQGYAYSMGTLQATDSLMQVLLPLRALLYFASGIAFCAWIHRAHHNLGALGARHLRFSPGEAVACFFVPVLNLFRPVQVAGEIWKASDPDVPGGTDWRQAPGSALVPLWWIAYLVSALMNSVAGTALDDANSLSMYASDYSVFSLSHFVNAGAALLAIALVQKIEGRQEAKFWQVWPPPIPA